MVIELLLHQPETTQHRGSLPPTAWTPGFREDPALRCCGPRDALCAAGTPAPRTLFSSQPQKPNLLPGGDAGDGVRCLSTHRSTSS